MGLDVDNWPTATQALIYVAGAIAALVMWLFGGRKKNADDDGSGDGRLQEMLRRLDRAETTAEIKDAEQAMEKIIAALRESVFTRLDQDKQEILARVDRNHKEVNEWRTETDSRLSVLEYMGRQKPSR
jgi:hypothetical protein